MNVADLELCRDLYEVSGWGKTRFKEIVNTDKAYFTFGDGSNADNPYLVDGRSNSYQIEHGQTAEFLPAYDLGYLIRKVGSGGGIIVDSETYTARRPSQYVASPVGYKDPLGGRIGWTADTPENAMCLMFIELFKKKILVKETEVKS